LDQELIKFYDNRFDLFNVAGWKDLEEELEAIKTQIQDLARINNSDELFFVKGQLYVINYLLNLKIVTEQAYEQEAGNEGTK
jgi:hypothetical protein